MTTRSRSGDDAVAKSKAVKAAWPYAWVEGVDYPHKDGRATVTGQLVLDDPQAASKTFPHLTVGLAHPDYISTRAATSSAQATATSSPGRTTATTTSSGPTALRTAASPSPTSAPAPTRCTPSPTASSASTPRPTSPSKRASARPRQARLAARPLRQADLGDRLPRPHRRQVLQGRRRQLLALGLAAALRRPLPQRHHLHHRQERLPQGLVLRGGPPLHHRRLEEPRRQGPPQPALRLGQQPDRNPGHVA